MARFSSCKYFFKKAFPIAVKLLEKRSAVPSFENAKKTVPDSLAMSRRSKVPSEAPYDLVFVQQRRVPGQTFRRLEVLRGVVAVGGDVGNHLASNHTRIQQRLEFFVNKMAHRVRVVLSIARHAYEGLRVEDAVAERLTWKRGCCALRILDDVSGIAIDRRDFPPETTHITGLSSHLPVHLRTGF